MKATRRGRSSLIVLSGFLGISAVAGSVGLLMNWIDPGRDLLEGSVFSSYAIPGWVLLGIGIIAMWGTLALITHKRTGIESTGLAGIAIIIYLAIEYSVIGFSGLQVIYLLVGFAMALLSLTLYLSARDQTGGPTETYLTNAPTPSRKPRPSHTK